MADDGTARMAARCFEGRTKISLGDRPDGRFYGPHQWKSLVIFARVFRADYLFVRDRALAAEVDPEFLDGKQLCDRSNFHDPLSRSRGGDGSCRDSLGSNG